jgi:hypothetical protein
MKRLAHIIIISLILSFGFCSTIWANENIKLEMLCDSPEYEEVLTAEDDLLEKFQGIVEGKYEIKAEDIRYEKAVKVYHDDGILDVSNASELEFFLAKAEYTWWIPVYVGEDTLIAIVDKMKPFKEEEFNAMPEDEKEYFLKIIGRWYPGSILEYKDKTLDHETNLKDSLTKAGLSETNNDRYILINGIRGIQYPVFVGMDDTKLKYIIPADAATDGIFQEDNNKKAYTAKSPNRTTFSVYSFEDVKKAIDETPLPSGIGAGGIKELSKLTAINEKTQASPKTPTNSKLPWIYAGGTILGIALITFLIIKYRKKQKSV